MPSAPYTTVGFHQLREILCNVYIIISLCQQTALRLTSVKLTTKYNLLLITSEGLDKHQMVMSSSCSHQLYILNMKMGQEAPEASYSQSTRSRRM